MGLSAVVCGAAAWRPGALTASVDPSCGPASMLRFLALRLGGLSIYQRRGQRIGRSLAAIEVEDEAPGQARVFEGAACVGEEAGAVVGVERNA